MKLSTYKHLLVAIFSMACLLSWPVHAAWFSATGQSIIADGNMEQAREQATREAIKQALLFAGANVRSVQQMTNGLLMSDQLEIRSSGEVNSIELIDEVVDDGVITVSIRADIFAQKNQCSAADYTKKIATTYFPIRYQGQATTGQIHRLGEQLAYRLQNTINTLTPSMQVAHVEPFVFDWHNADIDTQAKSLANKTNTQYVMFIVIEDISVDKQKRNAFSLHKTDPYLRAFNFTLHLVNGATGETLYTNSYQSTAPWQYNITDRVDVGSMDFWRGAYGQNIERMLQASTLDLQEYAMCQPTMGRVLAVTDNELQINLGRTHQVQAGDQLTLFKVKQLSDPFGQEYRQFVLHPTTLVVRNVYSNTATVAAMDNSLLGDVQPNDYVARQ